MPRTRPASRGFANRARIVAPPFPHDWPKMTQHTFRCLALLGLLMLLSACANEKSAEADYLGRFQVQRDLFLVHFDVKTDVDDLHSVAGVATMLADPRFSEVQYHAVAGAYGTQEGLYVPANELFEIAFQGHWSDAHSDFDTALREVLALVLNALEAGGTIWIAEAGQSDFSAALVRAVREELPDLDVKRRIQIVQHGEWNEKMTTPEDLAFVKEAATYHKIPDGNQVGNGTPGFLSGEGVDWQAYVADPRLVSIWNTAIAIANSYNGVDGRYLNKSIQNGGLDFSDVAEVTWIFGFSGLADARAFFSEFGSQPE